MIDEDPSAPGALAFHTEENGLPRADGYILTKIMLENGGVPLYNEANPKGSTVAANLFHELAEAFIDPTVNVWWRDGQDVFYAAEVCDPVQGNNVIVTTPDGIKVALSDFVFPAWRDLMAPADGSVQVP